VPENSMTILQKPQINLSCPTAGRMWLVSGCAFLCVLQSSLGDGGKSLIIALTALFSALLIELLFTWRKHRSAKINDGSAAATAMILAYAFAESNTSRVCFFRRGFCNNCSKVQFWRSWL